jgi:nucleoside phosphorylase
MIGIVCPSRFEYKFLDRAGLAKRSELVCAGMGKVRTVTALHEMLTRRRLKGLLLIGFAGGLSRLKVGDVVEPSTFIEQDYDARPFEPFPNTLKKTRGRKLLARSLDAAMLTQDRFLKENPYKNGPYAKKYPRLACDMESYAFAYFCERVKIRYSVLKFVSDAADGAADRDFLAACRRLAPELSAAAKEAAERLEKI